MVEFDKNGLEFPLPFSLKIIGRDHEDFREHALAIVRAYAPDLDETLTTTRMSRQKTYVSVTVSFTAQSRMQLDSIYSELSQSELVLMVI